MRYNLVRPLEVLSRRAFSSSKLSESRFSSSWRRRFGWRSISLFYCAAATRAVRPLYAMSSSSPSSSSNSMARPSQAVPYHPPAWTTDAFDHYPVHGRLCLGNFPTPLYRFLWFNPNNEHNNNNNESPASLTSWAYLLATSRWYVKRDDSTGGIELGGNKVRKLEFLLAEALAVDARTVITIGGEQSNHCRATAAAARMVGLEPHLILRSQKAATATTHGGGGGGDLGLVGNVLVDRLLQARIYTCTPGEYGRIGSTELIARLANHLRQQSGREPYCIPVGGSNGLGTWGYIQGVEEVLTQWQEQQQGEEGNKEEPIHHIVVACGSGGTAAGISLGIALAFANRQSLKPVVHAIGVCDDPDYFYKYIAGIVDEMGFRLPSTFATTEDFMRAHVVVHQGKGLGYAKSTAEELEFVQSFCCATGIVLDPVYSGKALYNFVKYASTTTDHCFEEANILFWHTGGALGLYEKVPALEEALRVKSPCQRLDVYGKGNGIDLSNPSEET